MIFMIVHGEQKNMIKPLGFYGIIFIYIFILSLYARFEVLMKNIF